MHSVNYTISIDCKDCSELKHYREMYFKLLEENHKLREQIQLEQRLRETEHSNVVVHYDHLHFY